MKRTTGILTFAFTLAAALVVGLFAVGCAGDNGSVDSAITVTATSQTQVAADKAALTITVAGSGETAEAAVGAATKSAENVMAHLKTVGVPEGSMKTRDPETVERYGEVTLVQEPFGGFEDEFGNWVEEGVNEYYVDNTETVVGYDATLKVRVSEFDAGLLGQAAREAKAAGATAFGNLSFTVSDRKAAYDQALAEAVSAAHAKAESLAKASGVFAGRLVNLMENSSGEFEATWKDEAGSLNIADENTFDMEPAKVTVDASVTASYAIS